MRWLVTAGGTQVEIDAVRAIGNVGTGRTGAAIAVEARRHGHDVVLLTSNPEAADLSVAIRSYRTFDELHRQMSELIHGGGFDCLVHSAAVSDFRPANVYAPMAGTTFETASSSWRGDPPRLIDRAATKVRSDETELWLRLVRTPKLIDLVRSEWGFRGVIVKFKLEVGVEPGALRTLAEASRRQSVADLMVANTLEGARDWALVGPIGVEYRRVARGQLAAELVTAVEHRFAERGHG
jgi:phosphopantothenoylcysteine synthetase/decarboxylase